MLFGYVVINNKNYFLIKDPWIVGDSHFWLSYDELNITTKNNFFGRGNNCVLKYVGGHMYTATELGPITDLITSIKGG